MGTTPDEVPRNGDRFERMLAIAHDMAESVRDEPYAKTVAIEFAGAFYKLGVDIANPLARRIAASSAFMAARGDVRRFVWVAFRLELVALLGYDEGSDLP